MEFVDPNLPRDIFGWYSPTLGMDMPVATYGHAGHPLLLYPTAAADFLENERFFLIKAIERYIFEGRVRVYSVESINRHAWMDESLHPLEKARRQTLYSKYIEEEVVPHIHRVSGDHWRIATSGASFGAFHAANQFFRRPDLFDTLIGMSGFYDLEPGYTEGHMNDDVYFNNPVSFVANLGGSAIDLLKSNQIHIITGRGAHEAPHRSEQLSSVLRQKGIEHNLDMWGFDVNHDWPWWRRMLDHYVGERLGW